MPDYTEEETANRAIALDFYEKAIRNWDYQAAAVHVGETYIQHSPNVADGPEGLRAFIEGVPPPVKAMLKTEIRRVLVDGDMVAIHTLNTMPGINGPGINGRVIVDIFRLERGKIIEHWDVVQDVPDTSLNANSMA